MSPSPTWFTFTQATVNEVALAVLCICVATLLYTYLGYPLLLLFLSFFNKRRTDLTAVDSTFSPYLSVIIPAFNEEQNIGAKLQATLELNYPSGRLEVIVVSDGSTDRTDAIVASFNDPRVRFFRLDERRGKTHAQNIAAQHAKGEILVFSDATTVYSRDALLYLARCYADPEVGAASGHYRYVDPEVDSPTSLAAVTFWDYENVIKRLQSNLRTLTGCSGCIYSVRAALYEPLADDACSDLVLPLLVVNKGYRVVFADRALAYEKTSTSVRQEFLMRVRVSTHGIRSILEMRHLLRFWKDGWISFQLLSHKVLRWSVPFFLILLLVSSLVLFWHPVFRLLVAAQVVLYVSALLLIWVPLHGRWRVFGLPLYFCVLNASVILGLIQVLRGNRYKTWKPER